MADITAEDVAHYPAPGATAPAGIAFSPDGRWLSFLWSPEHSLRRDLFVLDLDTGDLVVPFASGAAGVTEANLSIEERLRRERARDLGQGVTSAAWAKDAPRLLVPRPTGIHILDAPDFDPRLIVPSGDGAAILDARLSPDGERIAFVQDAELFVAAANGSDEPRQITHGARSTGRTHGLAEFVAQEEMGRAEGYWWSPDSTRIAFTEVDETHIPVYRIVHQGSAAVGDAAQEDHRYPFAGMSNAKVRLAVVVVAADGGGDDDGDRPRCTWVDLGDQWEYLARVDWLSPEVLAVQLENREQTRLDVVAVDPSTGETRQMLTETSDVWINLHDLLRPLGDDRFLWASERSGFRHLEVRWVKDGSLQSTLTDGDWLVDSVAAATEATVWFTATRDSALERHLYSVSLVGGEVERITRGAGIHSVVVDAGQGRFVDTHSSLSTAPVATIRSLHDGERVRPLLLQGSEDPRVAKLDLPPPEVIQIDSAGGTLHALLYKPSGDPPYPTVVSVYGGPHAQQVTNSWGSTAAMRRQWLRSLGYLVVVVDNRGSAGRGLAFEGAIRWDLGNVEVEDQVGAVRSLVEQGLVDAARVAINGWSYGGYMSAMCLAKAPDVFKVAIAGAPVTAWDGYDTHYTERYMGLPQENPEGYARSEVMAHLDGIRERWLLLIHGLIDENVHFRHTARLANALNKARVPYELLLFPEERHSPRAEADRVYMEERIRDYFQAHL